MFVNSLRNQIKWFLAITWNETLTDAAPSVARSKNKKADTGCIVEKKLFRYLPPLGSVRIQYLPRLGGARIQYLPRVGGARIQSETWQCHLLLLSFTGKTKSSQFSKSHLSLQHNTLFRCCLGDYLAPAEAWTGLAPCVCGALHTKLTKLHHI